MKPSPESVHIDAPLTDVATTYFQSEANFIARRAFPSAPVDHQSNKYFIFDKGDLTRDEVKRRGPGAESEGMGFDLSSTTYFCDRWALHQDLPYDVINNADDVLGLESAAVRALMQKHLIREERAFAADFMVTGLSLWTGQTEKVGNSDFTYWSTAGSTPLLDLEAGIDSVQKNSGFRPNKLVMGAEVWTQLKNHADLRDIIKHSSSEPVKRELLARHLEVSEVLVSRAIYNSADEGQTATMAYAIGKAALLLYVTPAPSIMEPSAGYSFRWRKMAGVDPSTGYRVRTIEMAQNDAKRIEVEGWWDQKAVAADCGALLTSCVA